MKGENSGERVRERYKNHKGRTERNKGGEAVGYRGKEERVSRMEGGKGREKTTGAA